MLRFSFFKDWMYELMSRRQHNLAYINLNLLWLRIRKTANSQNVISGSSGPGEIITNQTYTVCITPPSISLYHRVHLPVQFLDAYESACVPVSTWPLASASQVFEWAIVQWFGSTVLASDVIHHLLSALCQSISPRCAFLSSWRGKHYIHLNVSQIQNFHCLGGVYVCICAPLGMN